MLNKNNVGLLFFKGVQSGVRSFKRLYQCKMLKHIELLVVIKACPMIIGTPLRLFHRGPEGNFSLCGPFVDGADHNKYNK
jgi:hypothetical protein